MTEMNVEDGINRIAENSAIARSALCDADLFGRAVDGLSRLLLENELVVERIRATVSSQVLVTALAEDTEDRAA
jgi:hypothetical protein